MEQEKGTSNRRTIQKAVEKRKKKEVAKLKGNGGMHGGIITSRFIQECLNANELGDGTLYAVAQKGRFVYNKSSDEWFAWAGHHWAVDIMETAHVGCEDVVEVYLGEAKALNDQIILASKKNDGERIRYLQGKVDSIHKRVKRLRSDRGRMNCLKFAHRNSTLPLAIKSDQLDKKPWILACKSGVIDLKTGELRPGRPDDYLSKASPIEWKGLDAPAPTWEKTLTEIFNGSLELIDYVSRLFGYSITGLVKEHILPIFWGQGRNGKGTIVETISSIMGPLAAPIPTEVLLDQGRTKNSSGPTPDIMAMRGLRLAFASESDENRRFSPSKVKWLSGGDTLTGRAPHDRYQTTFEPTHKLILLTNHKPHAPAEDFAFWERVHLIPFELSFVDREPQKENERPANKNLRENLREEASGILAWLVRGCLNWQRMGLAPPKTVKEATSEYRRDEDLLGEFLEECCHLDSEAIVEASDLYDAFVDWFELNVSRRNVLSQKKFGRLMKNRFERRKISTYKYFGLRLLTG